MLGTAAAAANTIPLIFVRRCRSDSRLRREPISNPNTICTHSVVLYSSRILRVYVCLQIIINRYA